MSRQSQSPWISGLLMGAMLLLFIANLLGVKSHSQSKKSLLTTRRQESGVQVVPNEAARRVDVFIDGQPFTSYVWPETLMKPVLYPLRTAKGTIITRGFPLEPRAGESVDHPHQVGLWFNYGDVNGIDFWNNSTVRTAEEKTHMGQIAHRRIVSTKSGKNTGAIEVEMDWLTPDNSPVLHESTKFVFRSAPNLRVIDRITTLRALGRQVVFNDSKEGLLGLRVTRELEQPAKEPILVTDANGQPGKHPVLDNSIITGQYRSSEGLMGDDVWGTRGRWTMLTGKVGTEPVTLAILDHPQNVGFPTYWMARGYGLFAANPLGQKAYSSDKKETKVRELKFTLQPQQSVTFKHRILILSLTATPAQIEAQYSDFVSETK